jgi:hypothetical protein
VTPRPHTVAMLLLAALAHAQQEPAPLQQRDVALLVTSANERSVYLDHGRDAGLAVGTLVRLFPPGAGELEVEVRAVTQTSARADLPPGMPAPPVGTRGTARVVPPAAEPARAGADRATAPRVEHPPWTRREDERTADQPLLVPAFRRRPDERPLLLDGRVFGSLQHSRDRAGGGDADYWLARLGARGHATNVLGEGERWRGAGELAWRAVDVDGGDDDRDLDARLDLFSVAFGTEAFAPTGAELGRFQSLHLPELGLVDGVEVVRRYDGGLELGAGLGAYPLPFPARAAGDDVGFHVFVDWTADEQRSAAAAIGFQKTWHRGEADRDLVLLRGEWRPAERVSLFAHGKLDVYTSGDDVKGSGVELTEAWLQARWDGERIGSGLAASRFTWPELLREEYRDLPLELVRDGFVDRVSWDGSWRTSTRLALRVRADVWRDQDRDGTAFGADADWREPWSATSSVSLGAFVNDGGYAAGPGGRVTLRERVGDATLRTSYRFYRYDLEDLMGGADSWVRQSIEAAVSWPLADGGDVELTVERWFGDQEDATWLGLFVGWSF